MGSNESSSYRSTLPHRHRLVLRRWLGRRLSYYTTNGPPWRPLLWHNSRWTIVRFGSRRHHAQIGSAWAYRRMRQQNAARKAAS